MFLLYLSTKRLIQIAIGKIFTSTRFDCVCQRFFMPIYNVVWYGSMAKWLRGLRSKTWRGVDWVSRVDNPIIDIVLL